MLQKLVVGLLSFTVIGAAGMGVYDSTRSDPAALQPTVLANPAPTEPLSAPLAVPTATPAAITDPGARDGTGPVLLQQQQALATVGDPWTAVGTITAFDNAGMTLALADGSTIYVELGPSHYWQAQPVTLAVGDEVTVVGFYNGEQYHAATVITVDGSQLIVRTPEGLPLWSGGAQGGQGQQGAGNGYAGGQAGAVIVAPEQWITFEATVMAVNRSTLTVQTMTGETLTLQLGQPTFAQSQGVNFAPGDAIRVTGYWQETTFRAGDIVKLATGEHLMLLDPNGRPLWGGPGRTGAQGAQGQGNAAQQGQGQQGAGGASQGNGRGYRGGR